MPPVPREALCACEMNCQCGSTAAVPNGQPQPADGQRDEGADGHPPWAPPLRAIMRLRVCICARMLVNMAISSDTCSSLRPLPRAMRRLQERGPGQGGGAWRNTAVGAAACAEAAGVLLAGSKLRPACAPSHHHPSPPTHLREGDLASSSGCSRSALVMLPIMASYCTYRRSTSASCLSFTLFMPEAGGIVWIILCVLDHGF